MQVCLYNYQLDCCQFSFIGLVAYLLYVLIGCSKCIANLMLPMPNSVPLIQSKLSLHSVIACACLAPVMMWSKMMIAWLADPSFPWGTATVWRHILFCTKSSIKRWLVFILSQFWLSTTAPAISGASYFMIILSRKIWIVFGWGRCCTVGAVVEKWDAACSGLQKRNPDAAALNKKHWFHFPCWYRTSTDGMNLGSTFAFPLLAIPTTTGHQ